MGRLRQWGGGAAGAVTLFQRRVVTVQPTGEALEVLGNQDLAGGDLPFTRRYVFPRNLLQVVDVIQIYALQFAARPLNVARYGDVDEEQRALAPRFHERDELLPGNDRMRRSR